MKDGFVFSPGLFLYSRQTVGEFLSLQVARAFPGVKIKIDPNFETFVGDFTHTPFRETREQVIYRIQPGGEGRVNLTPATLIDLVTTLLSFRHDHGTLDFALPKKGEKAVEANLIMGFATVGGEELVFFIEHEAARSGEGVRQKIHLHARPVLSQGWDDDDDNLFSVVYEGER